MTVTFKSILIVSTVLISVASADFSSFITPVTMSRYNFKREKVDTEFNLDDKDYKQSLVVLSFPGLLLSIFLMLLGVIALFLRNCITCGRRNKSEFEEDETPGADYDTGSIISEYQPSKDGPTSILLKIVKFFVFLIIVTTVVGAILGLASNAKAGKDLDNFFKNMNIMANNARKTSNNLVHAFAGKTDITKTILSSLLPLTTEMNNMTQTTHRVLVEETNLNHLRESITIMGYIIAIITCAGGIFGVANGKSWSFMFLSYLSLLTISIILLAMAMHIPLSAASSDFCNSLDQYVDNDVKPSWMKKWINCETDVSISDAVEFSQGEIDKLLKMINLFSSAYTNKTYTTSNLLTLKLDELRAVIPIDQVSLFDSKFDAKTIPVILSVPRLQNMAKCQFVKDYFNYTRNNYCGEVIENVNRMVISEILIAVIWIPGFIFAVIYSKDKRIINNENNNNSNNNSNNNNNNDDDSQAHRSS
ncbi:hypothetical protein RB653_006966 [Dictyostelium firmibasis]|uniref:Uncharacterized protein n=1 Tax=Dictyostelium firmibasis TaxID=79012 RepID=A0AAN7TTU3_9MYCE